MRHGLSVAVARLHERRREHVRGSASVDDELSLSFLAALGEVLWWQVSMDDALGQKRHTKGTEEWGLGLGVRHARNSLSHGVQPWIAAQSGLRLSFPLNFPLSFDWKWGDLDKPEPRLINQWEQYQAVLLGREVLPTLEDHRSRLLG